MDIRYHFFVPAVLDIPVSPETPKELVEMGRVGFLEKYVAEMVGQNRDSASREDSLLAKG